MTELQSPSPPTSPVGTGRDAAKFAFAGAGLLAAFGVAACCALPLALAALGVGSAGLIGVAMLVGPYQLFVLAGAVVCLLGAGLIMWRQRRALACGAGAACGRPVLNGVSTLAVVLAIALLALTFWLEPPL